MARLSMGISKRLNRFLFSLEVRLRSVRTPPPSVPPPHAHHPLDKCLCVLGLLPKGKCYCSQTRLIWPRGQVIEKTKTNPFPLRQRGGECRRQSAVLRNQPRENVIFSLVLICVSKFLVRLIHQVSVKIQKVSNISPFCRTATSCLVS